MSIVEFKDLTFSYSKGFILENLNLNFNKGRFTAILGESGCGKTTILKLIAGVLNPTSGNIIKNFNKLGVVLQGDSLIENISVIKNIDYISGDRNMSLKALKLVGLENLQKLKGKTLSKGMKKRVEIARALSIEPDLMIMDEPFANLDYFTKLSLITGLKHFISEINATFIYITHDIDEALLLSDEIVAFNQKPLKNYLRLTNDKKLDKAIVKSKLLTFLNHKNIDIKKHS